MDKSEIETLLREHVRGVHRELDQLFRGIEKALDTHLAATEEAIARTLSTYDSRLIELERRVADLESTTGKPR